MCQKKTICFFSFPVIAISSVSQPFKQSQYSRVLGSCGFQWCGFHSCIFSKNSQKSSLRNFSLQKWRNSFTHAFLVANDSSAADLVHVDFCQTSKNARAKDQVYCAFTYVVTYSQLLLVSLHLQKNFLYRYFKGKWMVHGIKQSFHW